MDKKEFIDLLYQLPQKYEDFGTITYQMKLDIFKKFQNTNLNCIELGCYKGYTTNILSNIFNNVLALDHKDECLNYAKQNNANNSNVSFEKIDLYSPQEWDNIFLKYQDKYEVSLIDAAHSYESCKSDIINSIKLGCKYLILDDVGVYDGIKKAVKEISEEYSSRIKNMYGIGIDWKHYKLPVLNVPVFNLRANENNLGFSNYEFTWVLRDKTDIELNNGKEHRPMFSPLNINIQIIKNYASIVNGHVVNHFKRENPQYIWDIASNIPVVCSDGHKVIDASSNQFTKPPHKFVPFPTHRFSFKEISNMMIDEDLFTPEDTNFEGIIIELK